MLSGYAVHGALNRDVGAVQHSCYTGVLLLELGVKDLREKFSTWNCPNALTC